MANFRPQTATSPAQSIITGTMANRPSAGVAGRIYLPTDGYPMSYDNGSSWDVYVNGFKCTKPPAASTFTQVNVGAECTITDEADGLLITLMGTNSTSEKGEAILLALPSAPYTFTVGFNILNLYPLQHSYFGVVLTDGTSASTSKNTQFQLVNIDASGTNLGIVKQNNISSYNSGYISTKPMTPPVSQTMFVRLRDDATTRYYDISLNGRNWENRYYVGRTDFLTPTHAGILVGQTLNALATAYIRVQAKIFHWELTSG